MLDRDIEIMRRELLERFVQDFKDELFAATILEPDEDMPIPIVRVIYDEMGDVDDEAVAEFYFTPTTSDDDTVSFFTGIITLQEGIPEEALGRLYEAMSYINFQIPCGAFAIDRGHHVLAYRLCTPMSMDMGREEIYEQMNVCAGNSAAIADAYMGVLRDVTEEKMSIDEVKDLLGGRE